MRASARHAGESSGERHARVAQSWPSGASSGKNWTCRGTAGGRAGEKQVRLPSRRVDRNAWGQAVGRGSGTLSALWEAQGHPEPLGLSPRCGRLRVIPVRGEFLSCCGQRGGERVQRPFPAGANARLPAAQNNLCQRGTFRGDIFRFLSRPCPCLVLRRSTGGLSAGL